MRPPRVARGIQTALRACWAPFCSPRQLGCCGALLLLMGGILAAPGPVLAQPADLDAEVMARMKQSLQTSEKELTSFKDKIANLEQKFYRDGVVRECLFIQFSTYVDEAFELIDRAFLERDILAKFGALLPWELKEPRRADELMAKRDAIMRGYQRAINKEARIMINSWIRNFTRKCCQGRAEDAREPCGDTTSRAQPETSRPWIPEEPKDPMMPDEPEGSDTLPRTPEVPRGSTSMIDARPRTMTGSSASPPDRLSGHSSSPDQLVTLDADPERVSLGSSTKLIDALLGPTDAPGSPEATPTPLTDPTLIRELPSKPVVVAGTDPADTTMPAPRELISHLQSTDEHEAPTRPLPPDVSPQFAPTTPSCCERCPHTTRHTRFYDPNTAAPYCSAGDAYITDPDSGKHECLNADAGPWTFVAYGERCCAGKNNQVRYDTVPSGSVKSDVGSTLRSACDADPCTGKVEGAPGSPRRVEASILSTGPDIHGRDWVPEHPILKLGKDRLKPCHTEPFYVTKEATMQGAAKAVFTAMGLEHDAERAEASKGSACQGGGSHESATERAAKSAALGLLATQMKGQMKGLRAIFDVTGREEAARNATLQADIVNAVTQRRERLSLPMRFHADEAAQ